jgi:hypothetical protein
MVKIHPPGGDKTTFDAPGGIRWFIVIAWLMMFKSF